MDDKVEISALQNECSMVTEQDEQFWPQQIDNFIIPMVAAGKMPTDPKWVERYEILKKLGLAGGLGEIMIFRDGKWIWEKHEPSLCKDENHLCKENGD